MYSNHSKNSVAILLICCNVFLAVSQYNEAGKMIFPSSDFTAVDDHQGYELIKTEKETEDQLELVLVKEEKDIEEIVCEIPIKEEPLLYDESKSLEDVKVR